MHKPIRVLVIASAVALGSVAVAGIAHAAAGRAVIGPVLGPAPTTSASAKKTTTTTAKPKSAAVTTAKATVTTKATTAAKSATATTKAATSAKAATTTTAKKTTATSTAAKSASAATTVAKTPTTTAAPTSYRVQAGAARTRADAVRLQQAALDVDKSAAFVVTPGRVIAGSTYRVVSSCRTAADAATLKAALAAKSVPALVYRSQRC